MRIAWHDKEQVMSEIGTDLDSSINYKVNSVLKQKFSDICKRNQTDMSTELKAFMLKAVLENKLPKGRNVDDSKQDFF